MKRPRETGGALFGDKAAALFHFPQFHIKMQLRVGRDHTARTLFTVAQFRWNNELASAAYPHAGYPFVPALYDLSRR